MMSSFFCFHVSPPFLLFIILTSIDICTCEEDMHGNRQAQITVCCSYRWIICDRSTTRGLLLLLLILLLLLSIPFTTPIIPFRQRGVLQCAMCLRFLMY